jgi:hypothetical protein
MQTLRPLRSSSELTRISHHAGTVWGLPEGRGFSPAEIAAPALRSFRAPRLKACPDELLNELK